MKRIAAYVVIVTSMTFTVTSCVYGGSHRNVVEVSAAAPEAEKSDLTEEARAWARRTAEAMDTDRLAAQMIMPALYASDDYYTVRQILEYSRMGVGGVVLLKGTARQARALADTMTHASETMPFVAIDAEWGLNMRLADAPKFPANGELSPKVQDQLMYDYGREVARECRQSGINMVLGPVLDVSEGNRFIGIRSFGADAGRVADLGTAYGKGLRDGNVMPVAKHFPGHGTVTTDSHRGKGVILGSLHRIDSVDLHPFRCWIAEDLPAVMVGHLAVPAIDPDMLPAVVSPAVITDLLRDDMGFEGLVLTDALNMKGAEGYGGDKAVMAGADIIVAPVDTRVEIRNITDAVRSGMISMDAMRRHVERILFYKYLYRHADGELSAPMRCAESDTLARRLRYE